MGRGAYQIPVAAPFVRIRWDMTSIADLVTETLAAAATGRTACVAFDAYQVTRRGNALNWRTWP